MAQAQVYEGTPEQLVKYLNRLPNTNKYKMTVTPEEATTTAPNVQALSMLRDIARMKENMKETDGSETDRLLREARAGAMYGADPTE
ncbi:MAG: hypothetical protein JWL77_554 [Chthonomonadaceae bacterium]|nr:hypothetical protein [Chthonomonadaceae bacterium]